MHVILIIILAVCFILGLAFHVRDRYTTYPSTTERRLNTIKQLADDVIRDLGTSAPVYNPAVVAPTYQQPAVVAPIYQPAVVAPTQPSRTANIPNWTRNLVSTAAVQQLQLLNPGYTVRRIPMGSAVTREYSPNRITVVYDPGSNRVISASQG